MKIFNMDDCDWVAAETPDDAIKAWAAYAGMKLDEARMRAFSPPRELSEDQLDSHQYILDEVEDKDLYKEDPDGEPSLYSFRDRLIWLIRTGHKFPCFFASTEY